MILLKIFFKFEIKIHGKISASVILEERLAQFTEGDVYTRFERILIKLLC